MTKRKKENIDLRNQIYRTVASSTAIETGESICELEKKLKNKDSKFNWLTLT
ncbi:hypothetical protein [Psychromonas antarctica]|uniref:hypothetical protein n=1 Tax=Psychromonas antarctica TaxID=67573 RepID=UPI001EE913D7|nr:hypothetical protein [Psychromonas antarctica]MCG6202637.1 hypothetical protein [Psychromonas antarctica]